MRKSGINSETPNDFLLGAGTVFKNLKYVYKEALETDDGALEVVEDTAVETDSTIRIGRLKNHGVSFIGVEKDYVPMAGDFVVGAWDDSDESVIGATSGGNKLTITSELTDIEIDGATVRVKGLTQKTGETGSIEINLAQHTIESLKRAI